MVIYKITLLDTEDVSKELSNILYFVALTHCLIVAWHHLTELISSLTLTQVIACFVAQWYQPLPDLILYLIIGTSGCIFNENAHDILISHYYFFNLCSRGGWLTHCCLEDVHKVFKILSSIFQQAYIGWSRPSNLMVPSATRHSLNMQRI